ncbi:hypothetical protein [Flavonifractor sp. An91]|uniref:hypothetical protein n=1 Tax=Flavonifractor sp. An91 TaxID=1965665 RepID=UPI00111D3A53|nr:hypothetical protein [Flavonifractor sp. An91]
MNRYRSYMDRISAPESLADRVLEGKRSRRARPALAAGVLAACCLVAAAGGWQLWQGRSLAGPDPTAGVAATPAVTQTIPERGYALVVEDAFGGQPHSFPNVPGYDYHYPDCTGSDVVIGDYAYPEGWFMELLSAQEIINVLGGTDAVPWTLDWTGFGLDGTVIYDGEGNPWRIEIIGQRGEDTLHLELWPGREPFRDLIYDEAAVTEVDGVDVTSYSLYYDRDGDGTKEYTYHADYFDGAIGVDFTCTSKDQSAAARLASLVVGHKGFTADGLTTPAGGQHMDLGTARLYGSGELTLAQAYQQELAAYLPDRSALPEGFVFESAHWHFDEVEDSLSILWYRGYDTVSVKAALLLDSNTGEQLDTDVLPDEITPQAMEQRFGRYVDDDLGDTPGWRYESFTVHYFRNGEPTVAVTYSIKGLTPEEAAAFVNSCQGEWSLD